MQLHKIVTGMKSSIGEKSGIGLWNFLLTKYDLKCDTDIIAFDISLTFVWGFICKSGFDWLVEKLGFTIEKNLQKKKFPFHPTSSSYAASSIDLVKVWPTQPRRPPFSRCSVETDSSLKRSPLGSKGISFSPQRSVLLWFLPGIHSVGKDAKDLSQLRGKML